MPPSGATALATLPESPISQLEKVVLEGNLASLNPNERVAYYARVCESLGLNPLTRPFEYITLQGKLTLYARRDATDQLRKLRRISVDRLERERTDDLAIVTAYGTDLTGRVDSAIGAVSIAGKKGEDLANALMKAETKAKRRMTLSLAGLGWLDEVEVDSVTEDPDAPVAITRRERIAARTARLTGGAEVAPAADQPAAEAGSSGPSSAPASPGCDHKGTKTTATAQGVVCECGVLIAARAEDEAAKPARKRTPRESKKPDEEGYERAKAHGLAAKRAIEAEDLKHVAAAIAGVPASELATWSRTAMTDEQWRFVADVVDAAIPAEQTDPAAAAVEAEEWVWRLLEAKGKKDEAAGIALATVIRDRLGLEPLATLTVGQWIAVGVHVRDGAVA